MAGTRTILVGRQKTGKTTVSRKLLSEKQVSTPCLIYDINNEYQDFYPFPFVDFEEFLNKMIGVKNHFILIEEATIFFRGVFVAKQMVELLVRARHTNNIIQLNFHSFSSVPREIYSLIDYVGVFKTNDSTKALERFDNPKLMKAYDFVKKSKNPFEHTFINLYE